VDQEAAIRLGKALFWDAQAGSDGKMACASCHFNAGADNRTRNTIHPGDTTFTVVAGPGAIYNLVTFFGNDRVGSGGVLSKSFGAIDPASEVDVCADATPADAAQALMFNAGERLVTGRQAPPAVGAVYYRDNFWDGRASHRFNREDPLGAVSVPDPARGFIENASLASQAVGPALSDVEMSCAGRTFQDLGTKLVRRRPLALQDVDPTDSVLGPLSSAPEKGLKCAPDGSCTYLELIAAAFKPDITADEAIADFANIWGQAIQAYEATLVPNRTPYDFHLAGDTTALTPSQQLGLNVFRLRCASCHAEPELTDASVRFVELYGDMNVDGGDQGFHNIGVTPAADDPGRSGSPGGTYHVSSFNNGAFKTPALRNVALTAPYMHNGSLATLADVIEFYDNGPFLAGFGELASAMDGAGPKKTEAGPLFDFLFHGLTDCRVAHNAAPFDHPSLDIPDGPALPAYGAAGDGTTCP
jgi:cytochrome c peroxidase